MDYDIIIPHRLLDAVTGAAFDRENEAGAWALFSTASIKRDPVTSRARRRFILVEIVPFGARDIVSSSPKHLTVKTASFISILKRSGDSDLMPGFLHGHPSGYAAFSTRDDENESALSLAAKNRNGVEGEFVSLLALPGEQLMARVWNEANTVHPAPVTITGPLLRLMGRPRDRKKTGHDLDRQTRVFGEEFNEALSGLRVLIVGAGGTGSPLAIMLARAGLRQPLIIDPDVVEETNLHRLHGSIAGDIGCPKADVLANHINSLGLGTDVIGIQGNILDPAHRDLMSSVDLIFCCTDDHAGRLLLNRFAYFYEIPVIDIGLAIEKSDTRIRDMTGRVSLLYPGAACLLCRNIVDPVRAREEDLSQRDPEAYAKQQEEGYIVGGGDPEPAFISMTTSVATMAIEEMIQMLVEFRHQDRPLTQRLRRFQVPEDRRTGARIDPECPICGEFNSWGAGDVTPFLDRVS